MAAFRGGRKEFARFAPPKRDPRVPKMQYLSGKSQRIDSCQLPTTSTARITSHAVEEESGLNTCPPRRLYSLHHVLASFLLAPRLFLRSHTVNTTALYALFPSRFTFNSHTLTPVLPSHRIASEAPQAQAPQTRGFVCRSIDFSSLDNVGKGGVRAPQRAAQPAHGGGSGGQADPYGTSVEPIYGENLPRTAPTQSAPSTPSTPAAASTPTFRAPNNSIYGTVPAVSAFGTAAPVAPPAAPMAPVAPRAPPMAPSVPMAPVGGPSMAPPPPMAPMAPMKPSMGFAPAPSGVAPPPPGVPPPPPTMPAAQPAPAAGGGEPEGEDENFYGVVPLPAADPLYSEVDYGTVQQPSDDNLYGNPIASNTARNEDVSIIALGKTGLPSQESKGLQDSEHAFVCALVWLNLIFFSSLTRSVFFPCSNCSLRLRGCADRRAVLPRGCSHQDRQQEHGRVV